jgi:hypothetical protein
MRTTSTSGLGLGRVSPFDTELLENAHGLVLLGWVDAHVLYARCKGIVSAELGTAFVQRLGDLLVGASAVEYFADNASVTHHNPVARSLFERLVLTQAGKFRSIVMLGRSGAPNPAATLASSLGDSVQAVTTTAEFMARLTRAAPFAERRLQAKATRRTRVSSLGL